MVGQRVDAAPAGGTAAGGYRPWLDGVRAAAVLMVVAEHSLSPLPLGLGFVGVGLFFGLSGYLITGLLLDERTACGGVSLPRFYVRRAARLLPAVLLVVVLCDLVLLLQGDLRPLLTSLAALTYTANYLMIRHGEFDPAFGPTWSLAVEEHFYVLWPLVLLALVGRLGMRRALQATLLLCVAAVLWRGLLAVAGAPYLLLGIGSIERADALLYGCAAAMAVRLGWRPPPWLPHVALLGVVLLAVAFTRERYLGLVLGSAALAMCSAGLVVGLDHSPCPRLRRWLSLRPVVTLGVLSYGIYLWHVPLMRIAENAGLDAQWWRVLASASSVAAAWLSHRVLEAPVRSWARARWPVPAGEPRSLRPQGGELLGHRRRVTATTVLREPGRRRRE